MIETDFNVVHEISKQLAAHLLEHFHRDFSTLSEFIRKDQMEQISKSLIEIGPVYVKNVANNCIEEDGVGFNEILTGITNFQYEKYPSLLMTSLYLANGYP